MSIHRNKPCTATHYKAMAAHASDDEVIRAIRTWGEWGKKDWAIHRYYLRLLRLEARKRGLGT